MYLAKWQTGRLGVNGSRDLDGRKGAVVSLTDMHGIAVDLGPRPPIRAMPPRDVAALAAAFLHREGVPEEVAVRALKLSPRTYYRRLDRAAELAADRVVRGADA